MLQKIIDIKNEVISYSVSERIFLFAAMLCSFSICALYAIVRPVSDAIFITSYGTKIFPWAWLCTIPLNLIIVSLYNRFLPKLGCWKMLLASVGLIAGINIFAAFFLKNITPLPFLFYIWKEVFILFLFQQLWSVIHSTISFSRAKYLYGFLFAVGGTGGALGSLIPGFFAVQFGSENILFASLPVCILLVAFYRILIKHGNGDVKNAWEENAGSFRKGWDLIKGSKILTFILLIVMLMQIVSTLAYYQFNTILEATIGDKDLRTEFGGRIAGVINLSSVFLQVVGSFLLVHFLGLKRSHLLIPAILGCNALGSFFYSTFAFISYAYVTVKTFDFSIFGIIKEMLYIPLKKEEKFQAKAVIDVFAYRTAKAGGSFLILAIQWIHAPQIIPTLSVASFILLAFWIGTVIRLLKVTSEKVSHAA